MNKTGEKASGEFKLIDTIADARTAYPATGLAESTTYYFKLVAFDEVPNYSPRSSVVSAVTLDESPPAAPTGLRVSGTEFDSLELSWNNNPEHDLAGYDLFRGSSPTDSFIQVNLNIITDEQYLDTDLSEDTTYYYKLKAVDDSGRISEFSDAASGRTLVGPREPGIKNAVADFSIAEDSYDDSTVKLYDWFTDINNDPLEFRCEGEEHINVYLDQNTGRVTLTPKSDWNGMEILTFFADDGIFPEVSDTVAVTITPLNDPPDGAEILRPMDNIQIQAGKLVDFEGSCSDADLAYGDELTFKWSSELSGKLGEGKNLSGVALPSGDHRITLEVTDSVGEKSSVTIRIEVTKGTKDKEEPDEQEVADEKKSNGMAAVISAVIIIIVIVIVLFFMIRKGIIDWDLKPKKGVEAEEPEGTPVPPVGPVPGPIRPPREGQVNALAPQHPDMRFQKEPTSIAPGQTQGDYNQKQLPK
jgi:hypothetical protein